MIPAAYFNPRSLTGATAMEIDEEATAIISIHAPLRERHNVLGERVRTQAFQSTLPYGSDGVPNGNRGVPNGFQSTLPYGSDGTVRIFSTN